MKNDDCEQLKLRSATIDDADLLFRWVNDDVVRKFSFNSNIINYEDHIKWFNDRLKNAQCFLQIATYQNVPIGQIRIDIKDDAGVLDYSVDKEFRGKGIGHLLLSKVNRNFINNHYPCSMLIGMVKQANVASIKSFLHAGFDIKTENDDIITFHVSRNSR